jgi:sporulation protein YlmC with PRC-barrel domain
MTKIHNLLASGSLIGDKVVNLQNEHVGKIEELMISVADGKIAYAVMSFGGFLHFGEKFFAIPWQRLRVDEVNKQIVLDVTKESLEKAPGFDKDNWPDMSDNAYTTQINEYYKAKPREEELTK